MKSIVCMNCLPKEKHHLASQFSGYWDIDREEGVAKCRNCGFERKFIIRKKKSDQMTPSQDRKIEAVREWFKDYFRKDKLARFEVDLWDDAGGKVCVTVETTDHPLTTSGGMFIIGRRGGVEVLHASGIKIHDKKFYEYWLRG